MAAALVPLIASIAPEVIKLITGLVHQAAPVAEVIHGPATGPVKFTDVFGSVVSSLNAAANAGQIAKTLPSDDTIKIIIQAVVSSMQLSGQLTGAPAASAGQVITLKSGQSVTVAVG